ncbi:MFS transporter [Saccharopolyspora sp. NPDC002686]|uniref:MFS transporter n=1 Tax=Saccharopolyspora sp. NPDC002686 TaxID=3154541 RepID=UPI00331BEEB8
MAAPGKRRWASSAQESSWAPMASGVFRALWFAQLGSNVGTWMQTVGAQWLLVGEPDAALLVSLVQTAATLPVMLLAIPSGVLADLLDRRRLLISVQVAMAVLATALTVVTAMGLITPAVLLLLLFLLGCGQALTGPAWQAVQPELVVREQIAAAAALGAMNVNVARAIGPALAGVIVALFGPSFVFAVNSVSFLGIVAVLWFWKRPAADLPQPPERLLPALHAGARYVRHAPVVRRILLRATLFILPGSAIWALLPIVSNRALHLDAAGYGVLLGALGLGAVAGASTLSRVRSVLTTNQLLALAAVLFAVGTVLPAVVSSAGVAALVLFFAGYAWLVVLSTLNSAMQLSLPAWVRARGLATYLLVFMGGQALGSILWGALAAATGLTAALALAAALLLVSAVTVGLWPLRPETARMDRAVSAHWPEPVLVFEPMPEDGPVLVLKTYRVAEAQREAFRAAMSDVGKSRQRTGAVNWSLYQDGADAHRFVETFLVRSWDEHLRQHQGRLTGTDREIEQHAESFTEARPTVEHLFAAHPTGRTS